MDTVRRNLFRAGLDALYFSGAHIWLRPLVRSCGAILALRHVRYRSLDRFQPCRRCEITPSFFARVVGEIRRAGIEAVSLNEMYRRLIEGDARRRFVCFTFDGAYRDISNHAYPILKAHNIPFAIYVPTSFPDRLGELWWLVLEAVIARNSRIGLAIKGRTQIFDCRTVADKYVLYAELYRWLCGLDTEQELRGVIYDLAARYDIDIKAFCDEACMSWSELRELSADPLISIGAQTVNNVRLAKVSAQDAYREMDMSASVVAAALGARPSHLSYPFGDENSAGLREFDMARAIGFKTAVTSRSGVLLDAHRLHLTALPRITLAGDLQKLRYFKVLTSGVGNRLFN